MSLYDALLIGVSGLNAQSRAMSIFSSNIANVNTVGYKGSASAFQTMLGAANGGAAGLSEGVMASAQANIAQQGAEFATSSPTDLAITGNGFFCVNSFSNALGSSPSRTPSRWLVWISAASRDGTRARVDSSCAV